MVMKMQTSNDLPKNAFDPIRIEAFNHLPKRQHQPARAMIEFRHHHCDKFLVLPGTEFFANVFAHGVTDVGAECKRVKRIDEILFVEEIGLVASFVHPHSD